MAPNGDIVVAGSFSGALNLGGDTLMPTDSVSVFLARFSSSGAHIWSKVLDSSNYMEIRGLATNNVGAVFITGYFDGLLNLGGSDLQATGSSTDIFLAEMSADGQHVWSKRFGSEYDDAAEGLALAQGGQVVITGWCRGTINFGGTDLTAPDGNADVFVAKFDPGGNHLWSKNWGDTTDQISAAVGLDSLGDVYVAGHFKGTLDFGGGALSLTTAGGNDAFVAKLDENGVPQWANQYGDANDQSADQLFVDLAGNITLGGQFQGTIGFGAGGCPSSVPSKGNNDIYIARLYPAGNCQWAKTFGGSDDPSLTGVTTDDSGNVMAIGSLASGAVDLGGISAAGASFYMKLGSSGDTIWAKGVDSTVLWSLSYGSGIMVMTGNLYGTVDVGLGPLTSTSGSPDVFLMAATP